MTTQTALLFQKSIPVFVKKYSKTCLKQPFKKKTKIGAPVNQFKPSSKIFLLTVPRGCFFCGTFMLFLSCFVILSCTSVC